MGLDIAGLYLALRKNPSLTIPQFLDSEEIFYKVLLPRSFALRIAEALSVARTCSRRREHALMGSLIRAFWFATEDTAEREAGESA